MIWISALQSTFDQKKQELEPLGYRCQATIRNGFENVIQQPHYQNLIIGGLVRHEIIVSKEELMP